MRAVSTAGMLEVKKALGRAPWLPFIAAALVVVLAEHDSWLLQSNVSDDAMTSMQYAKNLARGDGLVFNAGERVEGYTNFLWVIIMTPLYALCEALHLAFVPLVNHLNVAIAAAVVGLVYLLASQLWGRRHLATWVAVLLLVVDNSFTTWSVLGLEVHLLALWMLLALAALRSNLRRRAVWAGFFLLLAHLTRPDAALFAVAVIGNELVQAFLARKRNDVVEAYRAARDAVVTTAVWALPYAAYFAWRYRYYGLPFPNTYYLKLGGNIDGWARGLDYTAEFFGVRAWVPAAGALSLFALGDKTVRTLAVYLTLHLVYVTYAGGDFMPGHRFFVPELPQFALLVGAALAVTWRFVNSSPVRDWLATKGAEPAAMAGFGFAGALAALAFLAVRERQLGPLNATLATWGVDHGRQRTLMAWLRDRKEPGATFATGLIGHTGFLADFYVIDVCGVIDPIIAHKTVKNFGHGLPGHEKIAPVDYVMQKKPTYVGIYVLPADLWRFGYYLDADVPPDTVDGLWVRDTLAERGRYLEGTRISFDEGPPAGWSAVGTAFEAWPSRQNWQGQGQLMGAVGGFVNSFHPTFANAATGTLRSPPFELVGDTLLFRLAGGRDPERLWVSLRVDGEAVFSTTGRRMDTMTRRSWDIRPYRDKMAELEISDQSTEPWGYIAVDEIVQWEANGAR